MMDGREREAEYFRNAAWLYSRKKTNRDKMSPLCVTDLCDWLINFIDAGPRTPPAYQSFQPPAHTIEYQYIARTQQSLHHDIGLCSFSTHSSQEPL